MQFAYFNLMSMNHPGETPAAVLANTVRQVRLAEELGFDATWFAEHHFSSASVCASPLLMATHCAAVTSHILLGPAVVVLPLHHPLRVAQEVAMLDQISGGRALLGFGPGHQPHEFRSLGVPIDSRYERLLEGWDIVEQALTTGRVHHLGVHYRIEDTPVAARTLSGRMPPMFLASSTPAVLARGVRAGATPMVSQGYRSGPQSTGMCQDLREAWRGVGGPEPMPLGIQRYLFVTEDRAEARQAAEGLLNLARNTRSLRAAVPPRDGVHLRPLAFEGEPTVEWLLEHGLIGAPEKIAEQLIADMRLLRPTHYSLYMGFTGLPGAAVKRALTRFGREVLPRLRAAAAGMAALAA
ncbi:LLM class flavin-dependent oxidoreductase [Paracraurococcus lichenis]|uniref:LLM class flavin-dependent oxidoreductase n=1 Tax=Paracraurococcus lichenis TaxID=3064888 RepID=A0ABT9DTM2_9PROT|nr:LLM class flavin-dependent oxidoreductase [Paracraurococcus sp. LOR1-02]MDO9707175.1 LLM class flavin-dependent oxidoreductase [Paracraurococcus sp. LOR1-02]